MKLLAFLLYGSLQAVRYKDCGTTGMKINDIKGKSYTKVRCVFPTVVNSSLRGIPTIRKAHPTLANTLDKF